MLPFGTAQSDANICSGCNRVYQEEIGCDFNDTHWWHYKRAGYRRRPSLKRTFRCSLRRTIESNQLYVLLKLTADNLSLLLDPNVQEKVHLHACMVAVNQCRLYWLFLVNRYTSIHDMSTTIELCSLSDSF